MCVLVVEVEGVEVVFEVAVGEERHGRRRFFWPPIEKTLSLPSLTCATIQHAIDSIPATKPSMSLPSKTQSPK